MKQYRLVYDQPYEYDDDSPSGIGDHGVEYSRGAVSFEAVDDEDAKIKVASLLREDVLEFGSHPGSPPPGKYSRRFVDLCEITPDRKVNLRPKVLNKHRDVIPPESVFVGRPSKWGNPFRIGMMYQGVVLNREQAIEAHECWLLGSDEGQELLKDIKELKGKDLVCFCAPLPCHADTLLRLANED